MPSLHELQTQFQNFVIHNQEAINLIASPRLNIYRNNIFITLIETLQKLYPTIERLVGEEFFNAVAHEYIKQSPSATRSLRDYGHSFAEFLATFPPTQSLPYLPEVAHLEWAYHAVLLEKNADLFDLNQLKAIAEDDYGNIKFKLHPASRLFAFQFPVLQIWQICQEDNTAEKIELAEDGENILVIRRQWEVTFEKLTTGEFALLSAFARGFIFEKACERALQADPNIDIDFCLQQHLLRGTITEHFF